MDFHTLSRKQLQALCKKNKIPANITNVAMADALAALNQVEGLDDFFNPSEGDVGTPSVNHRTVVRTSTQRKAAIEEAEGLKVKTSTRRVRVAEEVVEQENKDANAPPITPAASRRRATAVSTRRKKEVEMVEEDAGVQGNPKTPAAVAPVSRRRATSRSVCTTKIETPGAHGTSVYNTRRSVRLLEKDLSKMSLLDTEDTTGLVKIDGDVSQDSSNVSHQLEEDSSGDSLQMESTVVSGDTRELEVCSLEKNTEYECQSRDLDSDVKLVSVTEIDMLVEPHGPNEAGSEKVNCLELEAEPNASDEAGSESLPVLEESYDSSELETQNNFPLEASEDAFPEVTIGQDIAAVTVVVPDDVSEDVTHQKVAASLPMQSECIVDDKVSYEGDVKEDKNNEPREEDEPYDSNLKLEGSIDTCDKSDDADAPMEVAHQDTVVVADDVFDQDVAGTLPMSPVNDALKEFVECNTDDDQGINKGDDNQDMNSETENLNLADGNMAHEDYQHPFNDDEKSADERDSMTGSEGGFVELESISHSAAIEVCTESSLPDVEAEENTSENLEAEESEEPVAGEDVMLEAGDAFSSPRIPLVHQQVSVESIGNYIVSCPLDVELSCKSNTMVDGDVVSEDNAITNKEEPRLSMDSITENSIQEQLKVDVHNTKMMKENVTSDDLNNKSLGELKRMLRQLTLNEKPKSKTNDVKDVEKKRTALQVLPQNQIDG
ncbi:hypothetical protein AAZX31_11G090900 [Glycine max]